MRYDGKKFNYIPESVISSDCNPGIRDWEICNPGIPFRD